MRANMRLLHALKTKMHTKSAKIIHMTNVNEGEGGELL
jgi:hypothetical protein